MGDRLGIPGAVGFFFFFPFLFRPLLAFKTAGRGSSPDQDTTRTIRTPERRRTSHKVPNPPTAQSPQARRKHTHEGKHPSGEGMPGPLKEIKTNSLRGVGVTGGSWTATGMPLGAGARGERQGPRAEVRLASQPRTAQHCVCIQEDIASPPPRNTPSGRGLEQAGSTHPLPGMGCAPTCVPMCLLACV